MSDAPDIDRDTQRLLTQYREAVRGAIAELHAKGLSAIQVRDGYLVALQPDGATRKLYKLRPSADRHAPTHRPGRP